MRLAWLTDLHLDFVGPRRRTRLFAQVQDARPDRLLIGGDISEAGSVAHHLRTIADTMRVPVYFVLGNHDFYNGSITAVRNAVRDLSAAIPNLRYLPHEGVVELTRRTVLVGHDGWADGRYGNFWQQPFALNDYRLIAELTALSHAERLMVLNHLGDEAAGHLRRVLAEAVRNSEAVLVLTHLPPFWEACWYRGQTCSEAWVPHFACKAAGDVLLHISEAHPNCRFTVLCGHTHSAGAVAIRPNLEVRVAGADYGAPRIAALIDVD